MAKNSMKRRDFMVSSALAAGGVLMAGSTVFAEKKDTGFQGYYDVDSSLFAGINRVKDPADKSTLEKKHAPLIEAPAQVKAGEEFEVKVTVGEIVHPMGDTHWITYIALFAGNEPAGRAELSPRFGVPQVSFKLKLDKPVTLVVREYCNLHGLWESSKAIALA